ncbi:MAG: hypothetical protein CUN56_00540 [Phototrophicales bacterium]|nr:MAG: hypothetical protein CUN56_00540 [Phototrophicales bacterium]
MAYDTSNPPVLVTQGVTGANPKIWVWNNDDAAGTVRADGYITDADDLGLSVGDLIFHYDSSASLVASYRVAAINSDGSADLSDQTTIGSATDTD